MKIAEPTEADQHDARSRFEARPELRTRLGNLAAAAFETEKTRRS